METMMKRPRKEIKGWTKAFEGWKGVGGGGGEEQET